MNDYELLGFDKDVNGSFAIYRNFKAWPDAPDVTVPLDEPAE